MMKKIFTLLLLTMLTGLSASAKQTTVFKGQFSSGEWNNLILNKTLFASVKAGDVFYLKWTLDTEAAIAKDGENRDYYQFNISFPYDSWTDKLVNNTDVKSTATHFLHTLTDDEVSKLQTYGLAVSARFLTLTDVVYGDAFTPTEVQYWGTDSWLSPSTTNFEMPSDWSSCTLNGETIKTAKIGDRLTVTFTNSASLWDAQLQFIDASNSSWTNLQGIPVGGLTSASLLVDEAIYAAFARGDIRLSGNNLTITNIQLESTSLYYSLDVSNSHVDITKLPTSAPVNVELTRKFDWNTTLCLPFDVDDVATAFGNSAKAYEFKEYNDGLVFTEREHLEAGKPYFMTFDMTGVDEAAKTMTKIFENVTISTSLNDSETSEGLTFKGNYTKDMDMQGKYGVACVQSGDDWIWGFYKGGSNTKLNAFSAYFEGSIPSARLAIIFDNETTGINSPISHETTADTVYYNLAGQRMANVGKGLYIVNGKKMIIK